ncbi:MAG: GMC family oxidoreductase [Deltaproteobacteria bacterium]|nr:GMC family oxidoreductase [Deltaproteobacteria bacterium]MCB9786214.1 GMC family oxidoreductase [Deltaproteobacteria bacterium]
MILGYPDYAREQRFEADVVVVGTGAGGAVVGSELAQAGFRVTFVEEGGWHPTQTFSAYTSESVPRLYRDGGGTVILGKPPIPYVEGRCVGGSTVINGGMAYRAPDPILAGWARDTGAEELSSKGLEPYFEQVEARVSARQQRAESVGADNKIMREGSRRMGWNYSENPRNQQECVGSNNCVLGCPTGAKQSTLVTFMPTAMAAGARCLTEVRIDRLIIEGGRCVGVAGHAIDPVRMRRGVAVEVRANAVVIACGAIQTPHLLLKHKLSRQSGQLGRNFLCHPNVKLIGLFPFDVKAWQGVSQVGQVREFHDEGIVLAENFIPPAAMATQLPMIGTKSWEVMQRYNQSIVGGCLVEDSTTGRVRRGPFDMATATYNVTAHDHERFLKGARLLAEMWFAMGAEEVLLPFISLPSIRSADELGRIDPSRIRMSEVELFTPHLMGTARMGGRAEDSVIDVSGELWDLPGCHVADASIFPTAIGVNPQITIMAMAMQIAGRIAEKRGLAAPKAA